MPGLKAALRDGLSFPKSVEASLPAGMPPLSTALGNIVDALPDVPLPELPAIAGITPKLPTGLNGFAGFAGVTDFIRGVESTLPNGAPKFSETVRALPGGKTLIGTELEVTPTAGLVTKIGL